MAFQILSNPSFFDPAEQARFYSFFVASLVTICLGFIAAGRDGLMFDTRVVRGLHRLPRYGFVIFFFLYSVFLSIPQWILNSDDRLCTESIHFFNETGKVIFATSCSGYLDAINILFLIIILLDPFYIFCFLNQADYRAAEMLTDKIKIRRQQRIRFGFGLLFLIIKIGLVVPRFILILFTENVGAIILSGMNLSLVAINLFVHCRVLMMYSHIIKIHSTLPITDITNPSLSKKRNTSSDDDHHNSEKYQNGSDDDHDLLDDDDEEIPIGQSLITGRPNNSRPRQSIDF